MTTRIVWTLLIPCALAATGCPTRVVTDGDAGRDTTAATAGSGGSGGRGSGGAAGEGGKPEIGGQAGTSAAGTGGQAGAPTGEAGAPGAAGSAGQAGSMGSGGAGGAAGAGTGGTTAKAKDGERCALPSECASGTCTPFYVDLDGDNYGAGQAIGFCGTVAPVGYAAQTGDCCDTATNLGVAKLIHPGADFQPTSAGGVCNITWDYDCSGKIETNPQDCVSCSPYPACSCVIGDRSETACGTSGINEKTCTGLAQTQTCLQVAGGGGPGTIACK
ncbi:MAG: hypothetical protein ACJ8F1_21895 [Polyangia bacterium]